MDTCEWAVAYTDFDGTRAWAECGNRAATRVHSSEGTWATCSGHAAEMRHDVAVLMANMNWWRA